MSGASVSQAAGTTQSHASTSHAVCAARACARASLGGPGATLRRARASLRGASAARARRGAAAATLAAWRAALARRGSAGLTALTRAASAPTSSAGRTVKVAFFYRVAGVAPRAVERLVHAVARHAPSRQ